MPITPESSADKAASVQRVLQMTQNESADVKANALAAIMPPPSRDAADVVWGILVSGLVVLLVLSILGLTHVLGHKINDDKVVTVFTTSLAGLLGLFIKSPAG